MCTRAAPIDTTVAPRLAAPPPLCGVFHFVRLFPVQGHDHPGRRGGGDALGAGGHATRPQPLAVHAHGVQKGKRRGGGGNVVLNVSFDGCGACIDKSTTASGACLRRLFGYLRRDGIFDQAEAKSRDGTGRDGKGKSCRPPPASQECSNNEADDSEPSRQAASRTTTPPSLYGCVESTRRNTAADAKVRWSLVLYTYAITLQFWCADHFSFLFSKQELRDVTSSFVAGGFVAMLNN